MFLVLHVHAALQMETVLMDSKRSSIHYWPQILSVMSPIQNLSSVATCATGDTKEWLICQRREKLVTRLPSSQPWYLIFVDSFRLYQPDGYPVSVSVPLRQWRRQVWKGSSGILNDGRTQKLSTMFSKYLMEACKVVPWFAGRTRLGETHNHLFSGKGSFSPFLSSQGLHVLQKDLVL